jgi:hypothetical protein
MIRRAPVRARRNGYVVDLGTHETEVVRHLIAELRTMLAEPGDEHRPILQRLFPVTHPDDPEAEAEYQRLMREELVASKLASFEIVDTTLAGDGLLDDAGMTAFMQSVNSLRLVLGTMLDVTDDPDVEPELTDSAEHHLYEYCGWLLEWSVRAVQGR